MKVEQKIKDYMALGGLIGLIWGGFLGLRAFVISEARSQVDLLRDSVHTQYTEVKSSLNKIEGKLDTVLELKVELQAKNIKE